MAVLRGESRNMIKHCIDIAADQFPDSLYKMYVARGEGGVISNAIFVFEGGEGGGGDRTNSPATTWCGRLLLALSADARSVDVMTSPHSKVHREHPDDDACRVDDGQVSYTKY